MKKIIILFFVNLQLFAGISSIEISSTTHSLGVASNSDEVIINWRTPTVTDDTLSVYRWTFDKNSTSLLDDDLTAKEISSSSNSLTIPLDDNSDGEWFFHIIAVTELGDSGADNHFGKIIVDKTPPTILISNQILENAEVEISLKSPENGVSIFYTLDGSTPTENSQKYENPFRIYSNKIVKIIGIDSSKNTSSVIEKSFSVSYSGNIAKVDNIVENQIFATKSKNGASKIIPQITVSASDLATYKYRIDSNQYSENVNKDVGIDISNLSDGEHSIFLRGIDSLGNSQIEPTKISFKVDNTEPKYLTGKVDNQILGERNIFATNKILTISTDENATIRYTTDGDTPTKTFGKTYKDSISITNNTVVKLIAYDSLGNIGEVKTFEIIIDREKPTLPKVFDSQKVELNNLHSAFYEDKYLFQDKAQTFYFTSSDNYTNSLKFIWTLDKSSPNLLNSNSGNVSVTKTSTLKFLAVDEVNNSTEVQSLDFIIDGNAPQSLKYTLPENCIKQGEVYNCISNKVKVQLSAIDNETPKDINFFYTTTGKSPTNKDLVTDSNNTLSLNLTENQTTFKFVAYDKVGNRSTEKVLLLKYDVQAVNDSLKIYSSLSLNSGALINSEKMAKIDVNISNGGETLYYYYKFERNSSFSFESNISRGIDISKLTDGNYTLSVIASNNGEINSTENKITFTVDNTAPTNLEILGNRTFETSVNVTISIDDNNSKIFYTLNGATPSITSFEYNQSFTFSETTVLKAIGIDEVGNQSDIISVTFSKIAPPPPQDNSQISPTDSTDATDNNNSQEETPDTNTTENQDTTNDFNIVDVIKTDSGEKLLIENSDGETKNIAINFPKDVTFSDDGDKKYSLDDKEIIISNSGEISVKIGGTVEANSTLNSQTVTMLDSGIIIKSDKIKSDSGAVAEIQITSSTDILEINLTVNGKKIYFPTINLNGEKAKIKTYLKDDKSIDIELEIPLNSHNLVF